MSDIKDRLDAIQQRADAATEGPWEHRAGEWWGRDYTGPIKANTAEDRALIAASRTLVPQLAAALRAVLDEIDKIRDVREYGERNSAYEAGARQLAGRTLRAITDALGGEQA